MTNLKTRTDMHDPGAAGLWLGSGDNARATCICGCPFAQVGAAVLGPNRPVVWHWRASKLLLARVRGGGLLVEIISGKEAWICLTTEKKLLGKRSMRMGE
jgi:hypothetical protein